MWRIRLKPGFKNTINWNKFQSNTTTQAPNRYLDYIIGPSFQINRLFVLTFDVNSNRLRHSKYYLPTIKIEDYNVMVDGKTFFEQAFKNDIKIYDKIQKISTGQGEDYTTVSILDYNYFNKHYKMIAKDLSKQQAFGADPKATQKIKFTGNLGFANYRVNVIHN